MTILKSLGVVALLTLTTAPPVFAQAAVQEPGAFAFNHPDADVLNPRRPTAAELLDARSPPSFGPADAYASSPGADANSCALRYRSYDSGSGTFLGRDGRRHRC